MEAVFRGPRHLRPLFARGRQGNLLQITKVAVDVADEQAVAEDADAAGKTARRNQAAGRVAPSREVDHSHRVVARIGRVQRFSVRAKAQPVGQAAVAEIGPGLGVQLADDGSPGDVDHAHAVAAGIDDVSQLAVGRERHGLGVDPRDNFRGHLPRGHVDHRDAAAEGHAPLVNGHVGAGRLLGMIACFGPAPAEIARQRGLAVRRDHHVIRTDADGDPCQHLPSRQIDDRYLVGNGEGHEGQLAVRTQRDAQREDGLLARGQINDRPHRQAALHVEGGQVEVPPVSREADGGTIGPDGQPVHRAAVRMARTLVREPVLPEHLERLRVNYGQTGIGLGQEELPLLAQGDAHYAAFNADQFARGPDAMTGLREIGIAAVPGIHRGPLGVDRVVAAILALGGIGHAVLVPFAGGPGVLHRSSAILQLFAAEGSGDHRDGKRKRQGKHSGSPSDNHRHLLHRADNHTRRTVFLQVCSRPRARLCPANPQGTLKAATRRNRIARGIGPPFFCPVCPIM